MKPFLVATLALLLSLTAAHFDNHHRHPKERADEKDAELWQAWKSKYSKTYDYILEDVNRFMIWKQNLQKIMRHNIRYELGLETYFMGLNEFADMTEEEFISTRCGSRKDLEPQEPDTTRVSDNLPNSIDWRELGYVTEVKNQGVCGSCWAFSVVGALESQYKNATGNLKNLSEEQLVDCDKGDGGCNGGFLDTAYDYLLEQGSISDADYPYKAGDGKERFCKDEYKSVTTKVSSYNLIPYGNEEKLKEAVATVGPVAVAVHVGNEFKLYQGGVLYNPICSMLRMNHAVLVVGYGYDDSSGLRYWIVKNSWGTEWGDGGYIKVARDYNMCGIASTAMYPLI